MITSESIQEQTQEPESNGPGAKGRLALIVVRFLLTWVLFLVILVGLALLTNINWARSFVQRSLSETLHRKVHLGKLSWTLGLNGLAIDTHELSVVEESGQPLLFAGHSEIGIAFVPLLNGKLLIRHLSFEKPDLYVVRSGNDKWNFDDLLEYGPDIRFIELENGKVNITDRSGIKPEWEPLTFDKVKLKFVWPKTKKKAPFYLSFHYPTKAYDTNAQITALGAGSLKDWRTNKYKLDITSENFNPEDFRPFLRALRKHNNAPAAASKVLAVKDAATTKTVVHKNKASGLFNITLSGDGAFENGIDAVLSLEAHDLDVDTQSLGLAAKQASAEANVTVSEKKLTWHEAKLHVSGLDLKSDGEVNDWQEDLPHFSTNIKGTVDDLAAIGRLLKQDERTTFESVAIDPRQLSGKAQLDVTLVGSPKETHIITDVKAEGVSLKEVIKKLPAKSASILTVLGISENSKVHGDLRFVPHESFEIKDGEITSDSGTVKTAGTIDLKTDSSKFTIKADGFAFSQIQKSLAQSDEAYRSLTQYLWLPKRNSLVLGGKVDLEGDFEKSKTGSKSNGSADLKNSQIALADGSLTTKTLTGKVSWTESKITLDKIAGTIGDGTFELNGSTTLGKVPTSDIRIHAQHLDMKQLESLLHVFKVEVPVFSEHQLYGRVSELTLNMAGAANAPKIYFHATPEDLCYQPPGMNRPLRSKSGTIIYDHDDLNLTDVAFVIRNDKVITTLDIDKVSTKAILNKIKLKTSGIDLADVHYYLSSTLMPVPLRKLYIDFLSQYKLSQVHGRMYGDGACTIDGEKIALSGACGLTNVGARVGDQHFPVEHVGGSLSALGDTLTIDDLSGNIRQSKFTLDGKVEHYQDPHASWRTELRTAIDPQELLELVPSLTDQIRKWDIAISAASTLNMKAKIAGNNTSNNVNFSLNCDPADHVLLSGPFGVLHQPSGEPMVVTGVINTDNNGLTAENVHVMVGNSSLVANGSIKMPPAKESTSKNEKSAVPDTWQSAINFTVASPHPIPARKLAAFLDPTIAKNDLAGTVEGHVNIKGTLAHPVSSGEVTFSEIAMPKFNLHDMTGKLELKEATGDKVAHRMKLEFPSLHIQKLNLRNVTGDLSMVAEHGSMKVPVITLSNGHAEAAGGNLTMEGSIDTNENRLKLKSSLTKAKAGDIMDHFFGHPGELTGICDLDFDISAKGNDYQQCISNLSGLGNVTIRSGTVTRFGQLQTKLTQANLLHQGLFGFNLNNLMQSVVPVRTGQFKDLSGVFRINDGVLNFSELRYNGDDMRLWAAGRANLPLNTLELEVAGKIPRVGSSVLGPVGQVSKAFTLQKVVSTVTMHQLDSLPALPVLGEFAADRPRTFSFHVLAPMDKPKLVSQSIEKSFHWLPSKAGASAHPVPGL